jgi:membrane associated rhomboid family serine protease
LDADPAPIARRGMPRAGADMGIYDREYYRERTRGSGWFSGSTPACKWILIANIVCFLLPRFLPDDRILYEWFAAYSRLILEKGQVWRLITATFLHNPDNIWHIVGNMLFLWFIGREMEAFYGTKEFLWLYFSAAFVSTLCWTIADYPTTQDIPMVGASGAIMAVVSLYTFYNPRREFILFIFPVEMWLLLTIYVVSDLWGLLATRGGSLTAFAAHLGGFGYAVAFWSLDLRLSRLKAFLPTGRPRLRIVHPEPKREAPAARPTVAATWSAESASSARSAPTAVVTEEQLNARLDEILVKIAREGRNSLTDDEKRILEEASRRARSKRSERF